MTDFLSTLPPGLVTGSVYALLAMGLVFIYKATRVPNFAYGAIATLVAFFHYDLVAGRSFGLDLDVLFLHVHESVEVQLPFWVAVPISLGFAAVLGLVIERIVIRPFAQASLIVHVIVTLGLSLLIAAVTQQFFGADQLIVPNEQAIFPRTPAFSVGGVNVSWERFGVMILVAVLAAAVWAFFRFTATGLAIRAAATDRDVAALLGVSSRKLAVVSWVSGSMVAGVAGIALASVVIASDPNLLLLLSIKGFAAAIVGGMVSFPIAVVAAFGIGLGEEWVRHYLVAADAELFQGAPEVLTLGAVIVVLSLRPKWIFTGIREDTDAGVSESGGADTALTRLIDPVEGYRLLRASVPSSWHDLRALSAARRLVVPALVVLLVLFPLLPVPDFYTLPMNLSLVFALVILSFVVLVGWLGQVSLAQGAFVAVGGAGTAIASSGLGLPFPIPVVAGVLLSVPVSILIGLPALRLRGLHLAVATLAFGLAAERAIVPRFTGTTPVAAPSFLGSDTRLYYLFLVLAGASFLLAWRIQATRVGRSFRAIRDSETVASAYGIRPVRVKLTGFVVSGGLAALAGSMLTYQLGSVNTQYASVFFSITWLTNAVVAGIATLAGAFLGAFLFGLYPELSRGGIEATSLSFWPQITGAAALILIMAINPGGLASMGRFVRSRASAYDEEDDDDAELLAAANRSVVGGAAGEASTEEEVPA